MKERHFELSKKIFNLGVSLRKESIETEDQNIDILSKIMVLLSGIVPDKEDLIEFDLLCGMFSAKKLVDEIPNNLLLDIIDKFKGDNGIDGLLDDPLDDLT